MVQRRVETLHSRLHVAMGQRSIWLPTHSLDVETRPVRQRPAAVILGAGWSFVAGLPLAKDLLASPIFVASERSMKRVHAVLDDYERWRRDHPGCGAEEYISEAEDRWFGEVPWPWVVEAIQAQLAQPRMGDLRARANLRYGQRVINVTYCAAHTRFWLDLLYDYAISIVVTTNYDILAERSLRHRPMLRPGLPGFRYVAQLETAELVGTALPFSQQQNRMRSVVPSGLVPLAKLHGSLNWFLRNGTLHAAQDLRATWRQGGVAAIVAPVREKRPPAWLVPTWQAAAAGLASVDTWIVVGYSLPTYDLAMRALLTEVGTGVRDLHIYDPDAAATARTWRSVLPRAAVHAHPGLPPM